MIRRPEYPAALRVDIDETEAPRGQRATDQIRTLASAVDLDVPTTRDLLGQQTTALLRALPTAQRQCLLLAYWSDCTTTEIATCLDMSVGDVKTHCTAALHSLRRLQQERGLDPRPHLPRQERQDGVNPGGEVPRSDREHPEDAAAARDVEARRRDLTADHRDDAAGDRNMQADLRDVAATRRDLLADESLATASSYEQLLDLYLLSRRSAVADRTRAAADRHVEAEDRYAAQRDRRDAGADREASAVDRREASLDPLTGCCTRAAGFRQLRREADTARRAQQPLTVAFLDVDGLKGINDAHGHEAGDNALVRVVTALRAHLRAEDLVMRFGGDEFLCAMTAIGDLEVTERLGRVSSALAEALPHVSITVGLACLAPDETIDELFRRADAAFYDTRKRR